MYFNLIISGNVYLSLLDCEGDTLRGRGHYCLLSAYAPFLQPRKTATRLLYVATVYIDGGNRL